MKMFLLVKILTWVVIFLVQAHGYGSCIDKERMALLEIKAFIKSLDEYPQFVLSSWPNDSNSDCCRWERIKCDNRTSRVIQLALNRSMLYADYALLNLSLLYPFEELRSLDLSLNYFHGLFDNIEGYKSLGRMTKLKILNLGSNYFNNSILPFLNASLGTLILGENRMTGPLPIKGFGNLENLTLLDLSSNAFGGSLPMLQFSKFNKLEALDLSNNELSGSLALQGICELKNLLELDLGQNKFEGRIPKCFSSFTKLRVLDISYNRLSGKLPSLVGNLRSLEYLSLSGNNFKGFFSLSSLANLTNLKVLKLSSESNSLQVEAESTWRPSFELSVIELSYCSLVKIPSFLRSQHELHLVDLSHNKLVGTFPSWLLERNPKLKVLFLQDNSITSLQLPNVAHGLLHLEISINKIGGMLPKNIGHVFPNLVSMKISKNSIEGELPSTMGEMKSLQLLDLSQNNFSGEIPKNLVTKCYSLGFIKLSHNKFHGQIFPKPTNLTSLYWLYLDNNLFSGKIGQGLLNSPSLMVLDISNNLLTSTIPSWMGNFSNMYILSMSDNFLEGTIPISLFNLSKKLMVLDLSGNMLSGQIPPCISSRYAVRLYLHDNYLAGTIPHKILENIMILDLGNNKLSGRIPRFSNTQKISILLLRGNQLEGQIHHQLCDLRNVTVLDLSHNRLNGSIPSCLNKISFGMGGEDYADVYSDELFFSFSEDDVNDYYASTLVLEQSNLVYMHTNLAGEIGFETKHRYDAFKGGNIGYMFGLDLSSNKLTGQIPPELGALQKIRALNLSHNFLSEQIPVNFSNLKDIESFDLSYNRLHGQIPPQLTKLNFLAVFNVSYNHLSGVIPRGGQFDTFDKSCYYGNNLLCGMPTNRSCGIIDAQDDGGDEDGSIIHTVSFYWSFVATYVTMLLGFFAFLCIDSPWRRAWFRLIDSFFHSMKNVSL